MKKRLISLLAAIAMLCAFVPMSASAEMNINIGDYIQMG